MVIQLTDVQALILAGAIALLAVVTTANIAFYLFRRKNKRTEKAMDYKEWHRARHAALHAAVTEAHADWEQHTSSGDFFVWVKKSAEPSDDHQTLSDGHLVVTVNEKKKETKVNG